MLAMNAEVISKGETRESYGWIATIALPNERHKAHVLDVHGRLTGHTIIPCRVNVRLSLGLRSRMQIHASAYCERDREAEAEIIVLRSFSLQSRPGVSYVTTRVAECKV